MSMLFFARDPFGLLKMTYDSAYDCLRCESTGPIDPDCPKCKGFGHILNVEFENATAYDLFIHLGLKPETEAGTWTPDQLPEILQRIESALKGLLKPLIIDASMMCRLESLKQIIEPAIFFRISVSWKNERWEEPMTVEFAYKRTVRRGIADIVFEAWKAHTAAKSHDAIRKDWQDGKINLVVHEDHLNLAGTIELERVSIQLDQDGRVLWASNWTKIDELMCNGHLLHLWDYKQERYDYWLVLN